MNSNHGLLQWRQFQFFNSTPIKSLTDSSFAPLIFRTPSLISTLTSSPTTNLILASDLDGMINILSEGDFEVSKSFRAYGLDPDEGGREGESRCTHLIIGEGKWKGVIITLGDDSTSPYPIIKVWDLSTSPLSPNAPPPILLRSSKIQFSSQTQPHPVSAFAVSKNFNNVVIGLADGTVVGFRGLDGLLENAGSSNNNVGAGSSSSGLGLGKLRVLHEGKDPITGLEFKSSSSSSNSRSNNSSSTLFILTTSNILSYPISSSTTSNKLGSSSIKATIIDELGANVGCSTIMEGTGNESSKLVVARDEAIYVYGNEGREGCFAFEGKLLIPITFSLAFWSFANVSYSKFERSKIIN